jgi:hypothetical protein
MITKIKIFLFNLRDSQIVREILYVLGKLLNPQFDIYVTSGPRLRVVDYRFVGQTRMSVDRHDPRTGQTRVEASAIIPSLRRG